MQIKKERDWKYLHSLEIDLRPFDIVLEVFVCSLIRYEDAGLVFSDEGGMLGRKRIRLTERYELLSGLVTI